jgi:hypothetical protein
MKMNKFIIFAVIAALCLLRPGQASAQSHRWVIETVDAPRLVNYPTNSSLELYGDQPRVVFGGDYLYYAYSDNDGADWTVSVVDDSPGVGAYASLALDSSGNPHIAYTDMLNYDLEYAGKDPNNPSEWEVTTVDLDVSTYTDIAIDPTGQPHISYSQGGILHHAWRVCGGSAPAIFCIWYTESLGSSSTYTSIAVDATNFPHIAYHNQVSSNLAYADYLGDGSGNCGLGNNWSCTTVDSFNSAGSNGVSLALSGSLPRIAYQDNTTGLRFAYYDTAWHHLEVTGDSISGYSPSLVLTESGLPRILFSYYGNSVRISSGDAISGGTFSWEAVTGEIYSIDKVSLALKSDGTPCALYYRGFLYGEINYVCRAETLPWPAAQLVSETGDAGAYTSLQLTADGQPWIAYQDALTHRLKFTQPNATTQNCGDASGPWKCETVSNLDTGHYASLAIHPLSGDPAISHSYQQSNYDVQLSAYVGSGGNCPGNDAWDCEFIDDDVDWPGGSTALAYDASGIARIAYTTMQSPYDLMLATWTGSGGSCVGHPEWDCEVAATGVGYGAGYLSLALDSGGQAIISYYDAAVQAIMLAHQGPGGGGGCGTGDAGWRCLAISTVVGSSSADTSLRLISDDEAWLSYINDFNGTLNYAIVTLSTGYVSNELIESSVGDFAALALHAGIPYVAYSTSSNTLKFARRVGDGSGNCGDANYWQCEVVDSGTKVGDYISMQVNQAGIALISYHDRTLGDLKLARMLLTSFLPAITRP